jgi:hypothetical protein
VHVLVAPQAAGNLQLAPPLLLLLPPLLLRRLRLLLLLLLAARRRCGGCAHRAAEGGPQHPRAAAPQPGSIWAQLLLL